MKELVQEPPEGQGGKGGVITAKRRRKVVLKRRGPEMALSSWPERPHLMASPVKVAIICSAMTVKNYNPL